MNLNREKSGTVTPNELGFYLNHWGIEAPEEELDALFRCFDADGDGLISYEDF